MSCEEKLKDTRHKIQTNSKYQISNGLELGNMFTEIWCLGTWDLFVSCVLGFDLVIPLLLPADSELRLGEAPDRCSDRRTRIPEPPRWRSVLAEGTGSPQGLFTFWQAVKNVCIASSCSGLPGLTSRSRARLLGPRKPMSMPSTAMMLSTFSIPSCLLSEE